MLLLQAVKLRLSLHPSSNFQYCTVDSVHFGALVKFMRMWNFHIFLPQWKKDAETRDYFHWKKTSMQLIQRQQ